MCTSRSVFVTGLGNGEIYWKIEVFQWVCRWSYQEHVALGTDKKHVRVSTKKYRAATYKPPNGEEYTGALELLEGGEFSYMPSLPFTFATSSCSLQVEFPSQGKDRANLLGSMLLFQPATRIMMKTVIQLKGSVGLCTDNAVLQNVYPW